MPGVRRTRSLVCESKKHTSEVTTGSPKHSGIPCAMVLTVSFELSPVIGLLSPSPAQCASIVANLTSASRC
jgi:hypothetical protein